MGVFSCLGQERPNIILIMTDDQGYMDVGFNGNKEIQTPNLDRLAFEGIIFDRFYAASAVCSPTRASLITGRNPIRMNIPYANSGHMPQSEVTIAELLKDAGYATAHFGKWHLGTLTKTELDANRGGKEKFLNDYSIPTQHGYDSFFCTESKVPTFDPMLSPASYVAGESLRYGWRAIENTESSNLYGTAYWKAEHTKETEQLRGDDSQVIMDRVIPFIDQSLKAGKPFFTTIWFHTPHLPVVADSIHRSLYNEMSLEKQLYYGSITAMDQQIGRLWKELEMAGIEDNTILFFCSDNGPERETPGSAGIFRDRKRSLYEGGVRVPAFVIWRNHLKGDRRIDFPMVTSDYLPTILEIIGKDYQFERPLDGIRLINVLRGVENKRSIPIGFICDPKVSWVTHRYKLIGEEETQQFELYDLISDPSEKKDISKSNPELVDTLKNDLYQWLRSVQSSRQRMD